ncbi:MAG TPA: hypothetical protein VHB20_14610 [Verrucomicrobiae bacterium]|jgi:hypothetical protein|nr:hypothetical protein [Verrucomicrobiae bacterium]
MTPDQIELYRRRILFVLDAQRRRDGLPADVVQLHANAQTGLEGSLDFVRDQLDYLSRRDPPLVEEALKAISKERRAWRITTAGSALIDF